MKSERCKDLWKCLECSAFWMCEELLFREVYEPIMPETKVPELGGSVLGYDRYWMYSVNPDCVF